MSLFRKLLMQQNKGGGGINPAESKAGDICLYDISAGKLIIVDGETFDASAYPSSNYSPVGVVVVPGTHNVYGDGSCGVMSLKEMNYTTPDSGSTSYQPMAFGYSKTDIKALTDYDGVCYVGNGKVGESVIGTTTKDAYLPSDIFSDIDNPYDIGTSYCYNPYSKYNCYIPSPYNNDGTFNTEYSRTSYPSNTLNAMSDFDGAGNTQIITDLATSQSDWRTANTITNSYSAGYYPAACCCWRYNTEGTNQGDWYLPACGELGYIMPRFNKINEAIQKMITAYGSSVGVSLGTNNEYCSSSEGEYPTGNNQIYYLLTTSGRIDNFVKGNPRNIRAFLRVK